MTLTTRTIWIDAGHCDPNDPVLLQWLLGGRVGAVSLCSDPRKLPYPVSGKAGEVNPVTVASSLVEAWKDRCSVLAQDAADLLRPLYLESGSADGYVLVKNAPVHFLQGRRTFDEASALWGVIDRPNVMLGVPGSTSNLPAIRDLVAAGINVNVNKLYSRRQLRDVFAAVYDGLEARIATGHPISRIAVGASFDIFGLDHYIDKLVAVAIKAGADDSQMGKLAGRGSIAVARLVHHEAQKLVLGERFRNLSAKGAQEIRLVWDLAGEFGGGRQLPRRTSLEAKPTGCRLPAISRIWTASTRAVEFLWNTCRAILRSGGAVRRLQCMPWVARNLSMPSIKPRFCVRWALKSTKSAPACWQPIRRGNSRNAAKFLWRGGGAAVRRAPVLCLGPDRNIRPNRRVAVRVMPTLYDMAF